MQPEPLYVLDNRHLCLDRFTIIFSHQSIFEPLDVHQC